MGNGITIYWAGRLFNQAEFLWNQKCAELLRAMGYTVILPQEDAEKFKRADGSYDLAALAEDCARNSANSQVGVYNLDGPDVDSGTSLEAGIKIENIRLTGQGIALGVRTDFRGSSEDAETGVDAMFRQLTKIIRHSDLDNLDGLCWQIHQTIQELLPSAT